jgi:hypothetical protein
MLIERETKGKPLQRHAHEGSEIFRECGHAGESLVLCAFVAGGFHASPDHSVLPRRVSEQCKCLKTKK